MQRHPIRSIEDDSGISNYDDSQQFICLGPLGEHVFQALGVAREYDDGKGKVTRCIELAGELATHAYDLQEFTKGTDARIASDASLIAADLIHSHETMLRNQQMIYLSGSVDLGWLSIRDAGEQAAEDAKLRILGLNPDDIVERSWLDLLDLTDPDVIMNGPYLIDQSQVAVGDAEAVNKFLPRKLKELIFNINSRRNFIIASGNDVSLSTPLKALALKKEYEDMIQLNRPLARRLNKRLDDLSELLERFVYEPDRVFADGILEVCNDEIQSKVGEFVDSSVAETHADFFTPRSKKQKRNKRKEEYVKRQAALDGQLPQTDSVSDTATEARETCRVTAEELVEIDATELHFPWLEGAHELDVSKLEGKSNDVYVVRAQEPKNIEVKEITEQKLPDGTFDNIILQRARSLAEGIMPYQDGAVKKLSNPKSEMRAKYKDSVIWYTSDIGANATRVYFSVKPAPKALADNIADNDIMLVIMAETDKASQIKVLKRFTTLSHKKLANWGAGSI